METKTQEDQHRSVSVKKDAAEFKFNGDVMVQNEVMFPSGFGVSQLMIAMTDEGIIADAWNEDGEHIATFCNTYYEFYELMFARDPLAREMESNESSS